MAANALTLNYTEVLIANGFNTRIDYLSLDIDPAQQTLDCLRMLLDAPYRFSVITFEHDAYSGDESQRIESRRLLDKSGYIMVCGNISNNGYPFEDWYLDSTSVNQDLIANFTRAEDSPIDSAKYILQD